MKSTLQKLKNVLMDISVAISPCWAGFGLLSLLG